MTLYQFKSLGKHGQIEAICKEGVRLGEREEGHFVIVLYQINYFYIEVLYDKAEMRIAHLRSFGSTILLEPYLEKIDISELLQNI